MVRRNALSSKLQRHAVSPLIQGEQTARHEIEGPSLRPHLDVAGDRLNRNAPFLLMPGKTGVRFGAVRTTRKSSYLTSVFAFWPLLHPGSRWSCSQLHAEIVHLLVRPQRRLSRFTRPDLRWACQL